MEYLKRNLQQLDRSRSGIFFAEYINRSLVGLLPIWVGQIFNRLQYILLVLLVSKVQGNLFELTLIQPIQVVPINL